MNRWFCAFLAIALSLTVPPAWGALGNYDTVNVADTIYPAAKGAYADNFWGANGAATLWECVTDRAADDDVTYASRSSFGGLDVETFAYSKFRPTGLVDSLGQNNQVDSIRFFSRVRKSGGANNPTFVFVAYSGSTFYYSDTTTVSSTSYVDINGHRVLNPATGARWSIDDINSWSYGFTNIVNPSTGNTLRCTQFFIVIYYKRQVFSNTISVTDTWINSVAPSNNYGGDSVNWVGYDGASGGRRRILIVPSDTTALNDYSHPLLMLDSCILIMNTHSMPGGTHDVMAYSGGNYAAKAGTVNGSLEVGSATWNAAQQNVLNWDAVGADSTIEDGGNDRYSEYLDSVRVTAVSTNYRWRVDRWFRTAADLFVSGQTAVIPLIMQQKSEVSADSSVKFVTVSLTAYGHFYYVAGTSTPAPSLDSLVFHGNSTDAGVLAYAGMMDSSTGTTYENATMGGSDTAFASFSSSNYWGLVKNWTSNATSNDWVAGTLFGHVLTFRNIYSIMNNYGIGDRSGQASLVDSFVVYVRVAAKAGTDADGVRLKVRAPIVQPTSLSSGGDLEITGNAWTNATPNITNIRPGVAWKSKMARGLTPTDAANLTAAHFDTMNVAEDSARWDVSYKTGADSVIIFSTSQIPAAGTYLAVNLTEQFKAGLRVRHRWDLGGGAIDTTGFKSLWTWRDNTGSAVPDSFIATVSDYRIRFNGLGNNTGCCGTLAPFGVVYLNVPTTTLVGGIPTRVLQQYRGHRSTYNYAGLRQRGAQVGFRN